MCERHDSNNSWRPPASTPIRSSWLMRSSPGSGCTATSTPVFEPFSTRSPLRRRWQLVTNGLSEVQRARIERLDLDRYFDAVVISSEVGSSKPSPEIFEIAFELLGSPARESVLMIGDSLTSDVQGGINSGIATCWYNPSHHDAGEPRRFTHEIDTLERLPDIVIGGGQFASQTG